MEIAANSFQGQVGGLKLPNGLTVSNLYLNSGPLLYAHDIKKLTFAEPSKVVAEVSLQDLQHFIAPKLPNNISQLNVKSRNGQLVLTGRVTVLLPIPFEAVLALAVVDSKALFVHLVSVTAVGFDAKGLVQGTIDKMNPVVTIDDIPVEGTMDDVTVLENEVRLLVSISESKDM